MRCDEGYATLAVVGLLSVLALTAVALLRLATSEADLTRAAALQIETDLILDGVWSEVAQDLLDGALGPSGLSSIQSKSLSGQSLTYRASDESQKLSLPRASESDLAKLTEACALTPSAFPQLKDSSTPQETLEALYAATGASTNDLCCIRQRATPFLPSTSAVTPGQAQSSRLSDGALIRIEIISNPPAPHASLDVAAILTGRQDDPIWVLDWRRGTLSRNHFEDCL